LDRGSIERIGLGRVNDRYFLFHAGIGFDAAVVEQVERRSDLKRYLSHPLFVYAAIKTWFRHFDRAHPHFEVVFDDDRGVPGFFTLCMNTNPYTYLGSIPLDIAPEATLDRGLTIVTVKSMRLDHILRLAVDALTGSGLRSSRHIDYRPDVERVTLRSDTPFPYQVDGDFLGQVTSLEFSHEPDALMLVRPEPT